MPTGHPRRILLAVTGLTPQVVTETLYALACRTESPWIPDEIHLITTATGAENARLNLLLQDGWFHRLRSDFGLPAIDFSAENIHILTDAEGNVLEDIRTPEQNTLAADFITETVRRLTEDAESELHVSIAGGRKTMGYYLGYALSLYGRPQDRLSHVLVSDPYETNREFYYPTPYDHPIHSKRGDREITVDARHARVDLADIPFVRLRHGMDERLIQGTTSFSMSVASAQRALGPAALIIDQQGRRIEAGGQMMELPPAELALLAVFARRAAHNEPALPAPFKGVPDAEWSQRYLDQLRLIVGDMADRDHTEHALRSGMDGEYFSSRLSKLHRMLKKALGPAARPYLIDDAGTRPRRYRLALPPEAIRFVSFDVPEIQGNRT
jgi:CRISPR-associated protein (TIGR02584 family)